MATAQVILERRKQKNSSRHVRDVQRFSFAVAYELVDQDINIRKVPVERANRSYSGYQADAAPLVEYRINSGMSRNSIVRSVLAQLIKRYENP